MTDAVVVISALAPVMAEPSVRAEQVTQMLMGETAGVTGRQGEWLAIRREIDGYTGWLNSGYARELPAAEAASWREAAGALSDGAQLTIGRDLVLAPLGARLELDDGLVTLPDGRAGRLLSGTIRPAGELTAAARTAPAEVWALEHFAGTPYQWGGVSPLGVDCSGLVQTTFFMRGLSVPRDASQQAAFGSDVPLDQARPGDLLFFRSESGADRITHVAFLAEGNALIHSTIACGGVVHESFAPGSRADATLRPRLVAARRFGR
ncbi:MAG TPA: C40 family peptidase [Gemmatimonadales bacterium]|nr:C40 family peptidase [Gemmatimonadales bacterium]